MKTLRQLQSPGTMEKPNDYQSLNFNTVITRLRKTEEEGGFGAGVLFWVGFVVVGPTIMGAYLQMKNWGF